MSYYAQFLLMQVFLEWLRLILFDIQLFSILNDIK